MTEPGPLAALSAVRAARASLDQRELDLIDGARRQGATWAQIALALGLTSRQAAEQRRHRLSAAAHRAAKIHDPRYGHSIVHLRTAIEELRRRIAADAFWDARFVRAALVRQTVAAAEDAAPGSLFALAAQAAADLSTASLSAPGRSVRVLPASDVSPFGLSVPAARRPSPALREAVQNLYDAVRNAVNNSLT
jgi:hypothetical protein